MTEQKTDWDKYENKVSSPLHYLTQWDKTRSYKHLLNKHNITSCDSVIDLGCGTGRLAARLARILSAKRLTLVDMNQKMLNMAQREVKKIIDQETTAVDYVYEDILSFQPRDKFDLVISQGVLEHFSCAERKRVIRLHRDLCAPEGVVLIAVPTPAPVYKLIRGAGEFLGVWGYPDESPLTSSMLNEELANEGLRVKYSSTFWYWYLTELTVSCQPQSLQ